MKALALVIPSRFFMYRMFTSSSVIASTAFGLLPFPSYYSCLLRDSEVLEFVKTQGPPFCSLDIYKLLSDG